MSQVLSPNEAHYGFYDHFVDTLEDVTIPNVCDSPKLSLNREKSFKYQESNGNLLSAFLKFGNKLNAVESSESFASFASSSKLSNKSNHELFQSLCNSLESVLAPSPESSNALSELNSPRITPSSKSNVENGDELELFSILNAFTILDKFLNRTLYIKE